MSKTLLETVTGVMFDVIDPHPDMVELDDIAWSLSRQARFNGHTIPLIPYSVAQHSVNVSMRVAQKSSYKPLIRAALMHDAAESYISDIPSPIKHIPQVRETIKAAEDKILRVVFEKFEILWPTAEEWEIIDEADIWWRAVEAYQFMYSRGKDWTGLPAVSLIDLQNFEDPWTSIEAYEKFKMHWNLLK
jgi:5'-deoxynucleotidase YfbR-like HD superfamily hydrolase